MLSIHKNRDIHESSSVRTYSQLAKVVSLKVGPT